jgi:hypothetical protein
MLDCGTCHGQPHDVAIHAKYPGCLTCHKGPHALAK